MTSDLGTAFVEAVSEPSIRSRRSQADQLVELAEKVELFHAPDGAPYTRVQVEAHLETWPLRTRGFKRWLARSFYESNGKAPSSQALQDALGVLEGQAIFAGHERAVHVRVGEYDGAIYLDLGTPSWEAIEMTQSGWHIVGESPIAFRRPSGLGALPHPLQGGDLRDLRSFVNVDDDGWAIYLAYMVATLRAKGPYTVLNIHGEQGSAKTTAARVIRELIDPNAAAVRSEPREVRDLMIAATNGWLVALDNVSHLPPWLSDAICRLSTGGGFATRELYTDGEEVIFEAMRPVVLTGIEDIAARGDLLDRSLILYLPSIPDARRRSERDFWREFRAAKPGILGALLTAACCALRDVEHLVLGGLPRMADFAEWVIAAEPALPLSPGAFLSAYAGNRDIATDLALDTLPVSQAIRDFMNERSQWIGPSKDLLADLSEITREEVLRLRTWPKTPRALSGQLRRLAPPLRAVGIRVTLPGPKDRPRLVQLERSSVEPSEPSGPSGQAQQLPLDGDDSDGRDGRDGRIPTQSNETGCAECGGLVGHTIGCSRSVGVC